MIRNLDKPDPEPRVLFQVSHLLGEGFCLGLAPNEAYAKPDVLSQVLTLVFVRPTPLLKQILNKCQTRRET